jgi:hypothetical protein
VEVWRCSAGGRRAEEKEGGEGEEGRPASSKVDFGPLPFYSTHPLILDLFHEQMATLGKVTPRYLPGGDQAPGGYGPFFQVTATEVPQVLEGGVSASTPSAAMKASRDAAFAQTTA